MWGSVSSSIRPLVSILFTGENCQGIIERIITGGTGMIFKGSGFYLTDYKDKKDKKDKAQKMAKENLKKSNGEKIIKHKQNKDWEKNE